MQLYKTNGFNGTILYAEKEKIGNKKVFVVVDCPTNQPLQSTSACNLSSATKQIICISILRKKYDNLS